MEPRILYGIENQYIDITDKVFLVFDRDENFIYFPQNNKEIDILFGNYLPFVHKHIKIGDQIHHLSTNIKIKNTLNVNYYRFYGNTVEKLHNLRSQLKLNFGTWNDEMKEQRISVSLINPKSSVLQISTNAGKNSLIIASLLNSSEQLIVMEPVKTMASNLESLRELNKLKFKILNQFPSKRQLYQKGYILSFLEIGEKINITDSIPQTDTLIVDCEGLFYNILIDFPNILDNINLLILHNDSENMEEYEYIQQIVSSNFKLIYCESGECGGWGFNKEQFYQGWYKI